MIKPILFHKRSWRKNRQGDCRSRYFLLGFIFCQLLLARASDGLDLSEKSGALDSIRIFGGYVQNINDNTFHDFWHPGRGGVLQLEMPFYVGFVNAEIQHLHFNSRDPNITPFQTIYLASGWGLKISLYRSLAWQNAFSLGNNVMIFDQEDAQKGIKTESEFAISLKTAMSLRFAENWHARLTLSRQLMYTYKRIRLTYVIATVGLSFKTPNWLKEFLR